MKIPRREFLASFGLAAASVAINRVTLAKSLSFVLLGLVCIAQAAEPITVQVKVSPKSEPKEYATYTLAHASGFQPLKDLPKLSTYGGNLARKTEARGFFYTKKEGDRWWLVDPEGCEFINVAVCAVYLAMASDVAKSAFEAKFGSKEKWSEVTSELLHKNGFNGIGAWSDYGPLNKTPRRLAYAPIWNFMSAYGEKRGRASRQPGHTGYPNGAIFVFDPEFEPFAMEHAKKLAATKDDPWLLGHFSDNELPLWAKTLDNFLKLPVDDAGYKATQAWLDARRIKVGAISDADREAFLGYVTDRYYGICNKAIKAVDPNHLYIGSRFYGSVKNVAAAFAAAGKHLDVVSFNIYGQWTPDFEMLANWVKWSGKPFIASEFYAKGEDSGMANTTGAGWLVKTQRERGLFYQNFVIGLLETKGCVGWHYFRYQDNDPQRLDPKGDSSNLDSNKGIVTAKFEPWTELLSRMREVNVNVYPLIDYLDQGGRVHPK